MNNNLEIFNNFYKKTAAELNNYLRDYNNSLVNEKSGYLRDNLELFTNLNSDGKLIRGILIALGYKILKDNIDYSYNLSLAYELYKHLYLYTTILSITII